MLVPGGSRTVREARGGRDGRDRPTGEPRGVLHCRRGSCNYSGGRPPPVSVLPSHDLRLPPSEVPTRRNARERGHTTAVRVGPGDTPRTPRIHPCRRGAGVNKYTLNTSCLSPGTSLEGPSGNPGPANRARSLLEARRTPGGRTFPVPDSLSPRQTTVFAGTTGRVPGVRLLASDETGRGGFVRGRKGPSTGRGPNSTWGSAQWTRPTPRQTRKPLVIPLEHCTFQYRPGRPTSPLRPGWDHPRRTPTRVMEWGGPDGCRTFHVVGRRPLALPKPRVLLAP